MGNSIRACCLLFAMLLMPSAASAAGCSDIKPFPTKIKIELELPDPVYDLKKNINDINKDHSAADEWLKKNGMQKVWKSSEMTKLGYAEAGYAAYSSSGGEVKKYDSYGVYYCPFITHIDLSMMFRTRIVIPNNFKKGGCRFNTILEHELRHYNTNRTVAEEFVKKLYRDMPTIISEIENMQPYVIGAKVPETVETLKARIQDAIEVYLFEGMTRELSKRNGLIDTPEEYASSGPKLQACPD